MKPILSFIGWHNSGKTTLARKVVAELVRRGFRVGVVKSTKEQGLVFNSLDTDSGKYSATGAAVLLAAPDQIFLQQPMEKRSLKELANSYFSTMDIVVGEGFKDEPEIYKIEVFRGGERLAGTVDGVVMVATDKEVDDERVVSLDAFEEIADFLESMVK